MILGEEGSEASPHFVSHIWQDLLTGAMVWPGKRRLEIVGDIRNYIPMSCTNLLAPRKAQDEALTMEEDTDFSGAGGRCCC